MNASGVPVVHNQLPTEIPDVRLSDDEVAVRRSLDTGKDLVTNLNIASDEERVAEPPVKRVTLLTPNGTMHDLSTSTSSGVEKIDRKEKIQKHRSPHPLRKHSSKDGFWDRFLQALKFKR